MMIHFRSKVIRGKIEPEMKLHEYLAQLYTDPAQALEPIQRTETDPDDQVTKIELNNARNLLSRHKAVGLDQLQDMVFHKECHWNLIKRKVLTKFNYWISSLRIPQYLKKAKIIPLSKDTNNSPFPEVGQVRTIAVTPAISKLFELCQLLKIRAVIN